MKFFHIADLHLGKRYQELSLIEDQKYILRQICSLAEREKPDGVLIAGDVYDKSVPSVEAVRLFDGFLRGLADLNIPAYIISGNHDGAERLAFGCSFLDIGGIHISPVYGGEIAPVRLFDEWGELDVYLLPFIKPATVKPIFGEEAGESYNSALKYAVGAMRVDKSKRNVLVAHQFVTGARLGGSEELVVGDVGNVDAEIFADFDYVALGHIHGAQNVAVNARYSGTPLKYSLSEKDDTKSVTVVELKKKGEVALSTLPLIPLRDVAEIRGTYAEITTKSFYDGAAFRYGLLHIVLTDAEEVPDVLAKLRIIYPDIMTLKYDNARTRAAGDVEDVRENVSPKELFCDFYKKQNGMPLSARQEEIVNSLIEKIWGDGDET